MLRCGAVYAGIRGSRGGGVLRRLRSRRRDARHGATARARRHLALSSGDPPMPDWWWDFGLPNNN